MTPRCRAGGDLSLRDRAGGGCQGLQIVNLAGSGPLPAWMSIRVVETVPGSNCMAWNCPTARRQVIRLSSPASHYSSRRQSC